MILAERTKEQKQRDRRIKEKAKKDKIVKEMVPVESIQEVVTKDGKIKQNRKIIKLQTGREKKRGEDNWTEPKK